jgi:hypothetical protein
VAHTRDGGEPVDVLANRHGEVRHTGLELRAGPLQRLDLLEVQLEQEAMVRGDGAVEPGE